MLQQQRQATRLFDFVVIVGLKIHEEKPGVIVPFIKYVFPPLSASSYDKELQQKQASFMKSIPEFCFPDIHAVLDPKQRGAAGVETFSFVLTDTSGDKRWAYCRRTKINTAEMGSHKETQSGGNSSGHNMHLCFCIVSFIPCFSIFSVLLDELLGLQRARFGDFTSASSFLSAVCEQPLPPPGESLHMSVTLPAKSSGGGETVKEYSFKRPDDSDCLLGHVDFEPLLLALSPINILSVFASLLVERRIIFIANKLSTLSTCIQAALAVLYPLNWQHIFIPVLPRSMLTICCAPMPFVVGILRSCLPFLAEMSGGLEEEIIVVDIDRNKITSPKSLNDKGLLPPTLVTPLLSSLQAFAKEAKARSSSFSFLKREKASGGEGEVDALAKDLSNAFIAFMVDILQDYREHLVNHKKGIRIDRESFIEAKPAEVRPLLQLLVQTQMFDMFIQDRATRMFTNGAFERASVMLDGKIIQPLSRFTMYENGDISREDITKKVREMLLEAEEKEKEAMAPRKETTTPKPKGGFADFWNRLWSDEPEPTTAISIGAPDHSSFKKVAHPNQEEALEWLKSAGMLPMMPGADKPSEWKSAEVEAIEGDRPDGRTYCLQGDKCASKDPGHWATFQHVQKQKDGPLFYYVRAVLAHDKWQPRWCLLGNKEISFFRGNDTPVLLARHELKNVKQVTLYASGEHPVMKRKNCIEIERRAAPTTGGNEERVYVSTVSPEEAKQWLTVFKELGISCVEH